MNKEQLISKFEGFKLSQEYEKCTQALDLHAKFLESFPFRQQPGLIDELTPEMLYNPRCGDKDYFFNWIENKLLWLGGIKVGSAMPWQEASENINIFKNLMKIAVDDKISIANKIDARWEDIKGFGGDHHIVKKILSVYYPKIIIPIFRTNDWELFFDLLDIDYRERFIDKFKKDYCASNTKIAEKFEALNELMMEFKNSEPKFAELENALFMNYLYVFFRKEIQEARES